MADIKHVFMELYREFSLIYSCILWREWDEKLMAKGSQLWQTASLILFLLFLAVPICEKITVKKKSHFENCFPTTTENIWESLPSSYCFICLNHRDFFIKWFSLFLYCFTFLFPLQPFNQAISGSFSGNFIFSGEKIIEMRSWNRQLIFCVFVHPSMQLVLWWSIIFVQHCFG